MPSVYVDIGADPGDTATITFTTGALAFNRMWDIKINQVRLKELFKDTGFSL